MSHPPYMFVIFFCRSNEHHIHSSTKKMQKVHNWNTYKSMEVK